MKKFLPILLSFAVFLYILLPISTSFAASAADPSATPPADGTWVQDAEVTFVGKNVARSAEFLRWTLQNYDWATVNSGTNPLIGFWVVIRNIIYAFSTLFVLLTAFVMIVTRGKNMTIVRFIPKFIGIIILITFSFALVQFFYQITDVIQAFFLRSDITKTCPPSCISDAHLLSVSFDYSSFTGLRKFGIAYDESAFITLLLAKLTAITYYSMSGILLLRKIILWFFIILSPLFPILLLYTPLKNSAKLWLGEFLRWLLYAPLFSILLAGLVSLWRSPNGIPLPFTFGGTGEYPTAVNILLGGPGQSVSTTNSLNSPDTFALYVVAIIMLWVVILLPFLLLQILLGYIGKINVNQNMSPNALISKGFSVLSPPPQGPLPIAPASVAKSLPITNKVSVQIPKMESYSAPASQSQRSNISSSQNISQSASFINNATSGAQVLQLTNLKIPTIRDVARYETKIMSKDFRQHEEVTTVRDSLQKIANPAIVTDSSERIKYTQIREKLVQESHGGDPVAAAILNASMHVSQASHPQEHNDVQKVIHQIANPDLIINPIERRQFSEIKQEAQIQSATGNEVASTLLRFEKGSVSEEEANKFLTLLKTYKQKGDKLASEILQILTSITAQNKADLPASNKVQSVNIEDYEAVKKIWKENYQTMDAPHPVGGAPTDKKDWISSDIQKIDTTINLLSSLDSQRVSEGMKDVSSILPFFLIGGFSKTEIIAYLKAKSEAGKEILDEIKAKDSGESQEFVDRPKTATAQKEMEAKLPE